MPDWTYVPLRRPAAWLLGERRSQVWALRLLAALIRYTGGRRWIPLVFDHPAVPARWAGRFGASVPPRIAWEAIAVLPVQGASIIEINPVGVDDVATVRRAAADRRCRVTAVADNAQTCAAIAGDVDAVSVGDPDGPIVRLSAADLAPAVSALTDASTTVLARPSVLLEAGPGWFNRVIEAATPTSPMPSSRCSLAAGPRRWPNWFWASLTGLGLIVAGFGAGVIALGPVLLGYDRAYLGATVADLHRLNPHLVGFLQHDRITMAANMIGIGILYLGAAAAMRQGHRWARRVLLISGVVVFGSYFYFLGTGGFVEPLHTVVVVVLFPTLVMAVCRRPTGAHWPPLVEGPEAQRRRALFGQLLMVGVGAGLTVAGVVISVVGFTSVFVPTDLGFMGTCAHHLQAADAHLLPFIAHDRAGFGGALIGAGLAVLLISMWGWRRGQRAVWWTLLLGCACATAPVLIVHFAIGYTDFMHLLPVYVLVAAASVALALSKSYLTARQDLESTNPVEGTARSRKGVAG